MIQWKCWYCDTNPWIPKEEFKEHMQLHRMMGADVGTMKCPATFEEFVRRFQPIGLCDLRTIEE